MWRFIHRALVHEILFGQRRKYLLSALKEELDDRRVYYRDSGRIDETCVDIKKHPGGLREMEIAAAYHKVLDRLLEPVNLAFFAMMWARGRRPEQFKELRDHYIYLKRLRHLNFVLVASDDELRPETAEVLAPHAGAATGSALMAETRERMERSARIVSVLMEDEAG